MTQITVSIVSHGHGALLALLLDDIERLAPPSIARIIVTLNIAEPWDPPGRLGSIGVSVIRNPRPAGFGVNHNRAFRQCRTPWFAVLNPDLRLPQDPFPALLRRLADPRCGLAAPWQIDGEHEAEDFRRRLPTPLALLRRSWQARRGEGKQLTPTDELDWVAGAFMTLRSEAFSALGGFDERYRLYCEDVDLCLRLQLAGWHIAVVDQPRVVHDARRHSGTVGRYRRWHLASLARLWTSSAYWRYLVGRRRHRHVI